MEEDIEEIARKLTKAQRAYLTDRAEFRSPTGFHAARWMTFPPPNTHAALMRLGLTDYTGVIFQKGLRVRAHLLNQQASEGES